VIIYQCTNCKTMLDDIDACKGHIIMTQHTVYQEIWHPSPPTAYQIAIERLQKEAEQLRKEVDRLRELLLKEV
jgi:hypothetical protein